MTALFGDDQKLPQMRLAVISYLIVGITALLLVGFWKLQIVQTSRFAELAEKNRIRAIPIIAPRGRMLDREGRVIVDNYPSFSILLLRDDPKQLQKDLPTIADGLGLTQQDLEEQLEEAKFEPKFQPVVVKPEASEADIAFVESHRADLPQLELMMVHRRRYPKDGFLAHAIGYVGEVSPQQLEKDTHFRPGDIVGKSGLEKEYNDLLMGEDGMRRVIVNSVGKEMGRLSQTEATPGHPIQLTIDYDLQTIAEADMAGKKGAVVALDPRTGEVLVMLSHPAPDPNLFAVRIQPDEWKELNEDPDRPLLDRAIQAELAPGSVFKIVMATAMLETHAIPEDFNVFCPGYAEFYGRTFHCWQKKGHGQVGLEKAVVQSCDIFFYNVGKRLGIDRIAYYASNLGLGRKTGIDLPGEEAGLVPSEEWKQRVYHQDWYPGETISVAIGQGATVTTPLQMAYSMGGIALGGIFKQPHLRKDFPDVHERDFPISAASLAKLTEAMFGVVNDGGGTAYNVHTPGLELCGKTGSAQVASYDLMKKLGGGGKQFRENAWFAGFAPKENPEIAIAVLVEGGEHGASAAAPIARDIAKAYFDKKNGLRKQQTTAQTKPPVTNGQTLAAALPGQRTIAPGGGKTRNGEPRE